MLANVRVVLMWLPSADKLSQCLSLFKINSVKVSMSVNGLIKEDKFYVL